MSAFLTTSNQVGHHLLSGAEWQVLVDIEALSGDVTCHLVGETLELAKADAVLVLEVHLFGQVHGQLDGVAVVACHEEGVGGSHFAENVTHSVIVASVGVLEGVPDGRLLAVLGRKLALFVHVGAADELDAQVEVEGLRGLDLHGNHVCHALQVALVAVHNNNSVGLIKLVSHLLSKRLNCVLYECLLSVNIEKTVAFVGDLTKTSDPAREPGKVAVVFGAHAAECMTDLLDQDCALGVIKVEQVAACVASNIAHASRLAFREGTDELIKILFGVVCDADFG